MLHATHLVTQWVTVWQHHELIFQPRILFAHVCQPGLMSQQLCLQATVTLPELDVFVPHTPQLAQLELLRVLWCCAAPICL